VDAIYQTVNINHLANSQVDPASDYPKELERILDAAIFTRAQEEIMQWDGYQPTSLYSLTGLASELGVKSLYYKDEGQRFPPGSFKALGGAYAVKNLLRDQVALQTNDQVSLQDIRQRKYPDQVKNITVATATDGNHGRSVAWGAQRFGCPCKIYVHAQVSEGRCKAMQAYGAEVIRVQGHYDDSVHRVASDAATNGWFIVSDTSYEGYAELPRQAMAGYSVMLKEILDQLPASNAATHIFVQGGCGGLAAAACAYLWDELGPKRPRFAIVEPVQADCLFQSGKQKQQVDVNIAEESLMAGLSCGEVSTIAWDIIRRGTHDFLSMHDDLVGPTMRLLAKGDTGAAPIVAGESAVPGLAVVIAACKQAELKLTLDLNDNSVIILLGTEGASDPEIYQQLVGTPS